MTRALYDGIWSEFCDWGIELAKVRLADGTLPAAERVATWWTLVETLDTYLRLLHPVMPFVTEAIWGALPRRPGEPELLIVADWPRAEARDAALEAAIGDVIEWNFDDVNPPVLAWAAWRVYQIERKQTGKGDRKFLETIFHKMLIAFTWWVNSKDSEGNRHGSPHSQPQGPPGRQRPPREPCLH